MPLLQGENSNSNPMELLARAGELVGYLYGQSHARERGLSATQFAAGLARSVEKRFADGQPCSPERLEEYLTTLHVEDLALACACLQGSESAWETFVQEYRGYLRASARAITKGSRAATDAYELADSLFAELFGLADGKRGEHSLFRYFHGRSSLKTWLRTILAQRHIDRIRESKRWEAFEGDDGVGGVRQIAPGRPSGILPVADPHRESYVSSFVAALVVCLDALEKQDRLRLELYYVRQKTLAEIAKALGEHESSVSRNLLRVRRGLRTAVEEQLRIASNFSEAECALCFEYAAEDAPIDFRKLFPEKDMGKAHEGRKETP